MQAIKALTCQLLAGGAVALLLATYPQFLLPWQAVGLQSLLAALFSWILRQPVWWLPIHLLFIPAVCLALVWRVPAWLYPAASLLLILIFWGTAKGDVPLFLSSPAVVTALGDILRRERAKSFADIGAGIGSVVVPLAYLYQGVRMIALERAPLPWLIAYLRCRKLTNATASYASFWGANLAAFDVVFAFLSPAVMVAVGEKVRREMRQGSLFVSSSFPIPDWRPESVLELADRRKTRLYCYRITSASKGAVLDMPNYRMGPATKNQAPDKKV